MVIIRARVEDAEEILKIQKQAFIATAKIDKDMNISPLTQTLDELTADFSGHIFLKAVEGDVIIGSAKVRISEGTGYVGRVMVLDEYQNRGIGKDLMQQIEIEFPEVKRYELFTGKSGEKNVTFYQKLGYRIFKEVKWSEKVTLLYMEKYIFRKES